MLMISFRNHSICRQYRKYKEINDMIDKKKNKKLKGGTIHKITQNDKIYMLIPSRN